MSWDVPRLLGMSPQSSLMCPTCPRTTTDIPGCPWHAHVSQDVPGMVHGTTNSQVQVVPSVPRQLWTSQDNLGHPRLSLAWCMAPPSPRSKLKQLNYVLCSARDNIFAGWSSTKICGNYGSIIIWVMMQMVTASPAALPCISFDRTCIFWKLQR